MHFKKIILAIIIIIILSFIITFTLTDKKTENNTLKKLTIGIYYGDTSGLILLAKKKGLFKKNGLDVKLKFYASGKLAMDAMLRGEVDYSNAAEFVVVKNSFKRNDFKIIASMAEADINGMIAKKSNGIINKLDIKNKTVGVSIGTVAEYYLGIFLEQNALKIADVNLVDTHPLKLEEELMKDNIDVAFGWEPYLYNIRKKYPSDITYFPMTKGFPFYFLLIANDKIHEKYPEISKNILKSLKESENWILLNQEEFRVFLKDSFNLREDYSKYTIKKHSFELTLPYSLTTVINNQVSWIIENNIVDGKEPDISNIIDSNTLKEVDSSSVTIIE